jgi:hypothetical protein
MIVIRITCALDVSYGTLYENIKGIHEEQSKA